MIHNFKKTIQLIVLLVFITPASAIVMNWGIHSKWWMLVCAGFGYSLELDNVNATFRLKYGSECGTVLQPVYRGKFNIDRQSLVLDFGEIKAYYYLKSPYSPACDNISDSLSISEQRLICDPTHFSDVKSFLAPDMKDKVFLKKSTLFPLKIEGKGNDEWVEALVKDLKYHCFIASEKE